MRKLTCLQAPIALVLLAIVLAMSSGVTSGLRPTPSTSDEQVGQRRARNTVKDEAMLLGKGEEEEMMKESSVTGSRLPDCTHACGPCFPCRRVMVSFRCAESAESCPIAYRCMCRGRFYHVPSL